MSRILIFLCKRPASRVRLYFQFNKAIMALTKTHGEINNCAVAASQQTWLRSRNPRPCQSTIVIREPTYRPIREEEPRWWPSPPITACTVSEAEPRIATGTRLRPVSVTRDISDKAPIQPVRVCTERYPNGSGSTRARPHRPPERHPHRPRGASSGPVRQARGRTAEWRARADRCVNCAPRSSRQWPTRESPPPSEPPGHRTGLRHTRCPVTSRPPRRRAS